MDDLAREMRAAAEEDAEMARKRMRRPMGVEMEVLTVQRGGPGTKRRGRVPSASRLASSLSEALEAVRERRRQRGMSPRANRVLADALRSADVALEGRRLPMADMTFTLEEAEGRPERRRQARRRVMRRSERPVRNLRRALRRGAIGRMLESKK